MNNVVNFASYANLRNERRAQVGFAVADVVAFEPLGEQTESWSWLCF